MEKDEKKLSLDNEELKKILMEEEKRKNKKPSIKESIFLDNKKKMPKTIEDSLDAGGMSFEDFKRFLSSISETKTAPIIEDSVHPQPPPREILSDRSNERRNDFRGYDLSSQENEEPKYSMDPSEFFTDVRFVSNSRRAPSLTEAGRNFEPFRGVSVDPMSEMRSMIGQTNSSSEYVIQETRFDEKNLDPLGKKKYDLNEGQ